MNIFKRYRRKKEILFICKEIIIKSLTEYSHINEDMQKLLLDRAEITIAGESITCLLDSFSIFYKNGIYELCIPHATIYDIIEKNIETHFSIVDITNNKYNNWLIIQFI